MASTISGRTAKAREREPPVRPHHHRADAQQHDRVVGHGSDPGGEEIVQRVDVRGHAGHQAPDRTAVEETHGQALHALEDFFSQIVQRLLPDVLHDADLQILNREAQEQRRQRKQRNERDTAQRLAPRNQAGDARDHVLVNRDSEELRSNHLEGADEQGQEDRKDHTPPVGPKIGHQPPQQVRVVSLP